MLVGAVFLLEFDPVQNPCWMLDKCVISDSLRELNYVTEVEYGVDTESAYVVTVDPRRFEVCEYKFSYGLMSIMESQIEDKFNLALDRCFMGAKFVMDADTDDEARWIVTELPRKATSNIRAYPYYRIVNTDTGASIGMDRDKLAEHLTASKTNRR